MSKVYGSNWYEQVESFIRKNFHGEPPIMLLRELLKLRGKEVIESSQFEHNTAATVKLCAFLSNNFIGEYKDNAPAGPFCIELLGELLRRQRSHAC